MWGVIRVLEGRLRYQVLEPNSEVILEPGRPGLLLPDQPISSNRSARCECKSKSTIGCLI